MTEEPVVQIPVRPFFYTLDQIASILQVSVPVVRQMVTFTGRSNRIRTRRKMSAINIARPEVSPDWRVEETEFFRWLKFNGYVNRRV